MKNADYLTAEDVANLTRLDKLAAPHKAAIKDYTAQRERILGKARDKAYRARKKGE
jgi:hypothetical protein